MPTIAASHSSIALEMEDLLPDASLGALEGGVKVIFPNRDEDDGGGDEGIADTLVDVVEVVVLVEVVEFEPVEVTEVVVDTSGAIAVAVFGILVGGGIYILR